MQITDAQKTVLRESYQRLRPELDRVAGDFYADLFRRDPRIRALFRDDISDQGMQFMGAIAVILDHLDDPARLDAEVEKLAGGHAPIGIRPDWYKTMQEALLDTFRYALGARFTDEIHLAWRDVFEQICARMQTRATTQPSGSTT